MTFNSVNERDKFIEDNLALVSYILNKYFSKFTDDMLQEGRLALIKAVDRFDDTKDVKFSTFASNYIYLSVKTYLNYDFVIKPLKRKTEKGYFLYKDIVSLDCKVPSVSTENNNIVYSDIIVDENLSTFEEQIESKDSVEYFINSYLTDREKLVIKLYLRGITQEEISKSLNVSKAAISRTLSRIRIKYNKCNKTNYTKRKKEG